MNPVFPLIILAIAFSFTSCATTQVDDAFDGDLGYVKETHAIIDYCHGCHVHRDLDPIKHMAAMPSLYSAEPYISTDNCRTCHTIRRDFWGDIIRSTRFPDGRVFSG